jgi:hypothetical protein
MSQGGRYAITAEDEEHVAEDQEAIPEWEVASRGELMAAVDREPVPAAGVDASTHGERGER